MIKFALFLGCNVQARLPQHERATRAVFGKLGITLLDIKEFNCCGYPLRNINFNGHVLLAARNLALAEQEDANIMTLCGCGFGTLKKVNQLLREDAELRDEVNSHLRKEGLKYKGAIEIRHFSQVLHQEVGLKRIKESLTKRFDGLKIATHYGCHTIRPSKIVQFDDPVVPTLFDQLVEVSGAESVPWELKLDCCGAPLWGFNNELSMSLTGKKIHDASKAGADYLCSACSYCQLQFDTVQGMMLAEGKIKRPVPSIFYMQLLGLCMGIDSRELGLEMNHVPSSGIEGFFMSQISASDREV
jgi:heterodisulfide reductase subunit B